MTSKLVSGIRQPKQARSADTLARIVGAARSLLDETSFGDLSVSQIMARAAMSVGTFYTRFANKDALLPYLYEHYDAELERTTGAALRRGGWADLGLAERVRRLAAITVDSYQVHRGLWRAILLHAASDPEIVTETYRERRRQMVQRTIALLLERRAEMSHPDPERGVGFALTLMFATCKDQILLAERSHGTTALSDDRLKLELSRAVLGYLGVSDVTPSE